MIHLWNNRFKILLVMLIVVIVILPMLMDFSHQLKTVTSEVVALGATMLLLVAATLAISGRQRVPMVIGTLMLVSMINEIATAFLPYAAVAVGHHCLRLVFFVLIVVELMRIIFRARIVTYDIIFASLCVYLILGALWSNLYAICDVMTPGSIGPAGSSPGSTLAVDDMTRTFRTLYFSLVTLSTVGYGDLVPLTPTTRMLAACEALVGQCYLLVMVSRLVGLHVSQAFATAHKRD